MHTTNHKVTLRPRSESQKCPFKLPQPLILSGFLLELDVRTAEQSALARLLEADQHIIALLLQNAGGAGREDTALEVESIVLVKGDTLRSRIRGVERDDVDARHGGRTAGRDVDVGGLASSIGVDAVRCCGEGGAGARLDKECVAGARLDSDLLALDGRGEVKVGDVDRQLEACTCSGRRSDGSKQSDGFE